jgi:hypothetical protein
MKITIIGGGQAGVWTALHYGYWTRNDKDIEVELIYDPEIDPFPVGQGMNLPAVELLWKACGTDWYHNETRSTPKVGILYENFSKENTNIYHPFPYINIAIQADPKYLQRYILNSGLFNVKEENVTDLDTVDADVIFDCRGNTKKDDIEYEPLYCPVNSVLLAVGPSSNVAQLWSRHVATPDGWTFVIPNTTNTTSYGYLYNKDITSLETAQTNFSELFGKEFPNEMKTVNLPFESYMAKEPLRIDSNGRKIILNGNRLAFLEPMEATAIGFYLTVAEFTFDWVMDKSNSNSNLSQKAEMPMSIYQMQNITSNIKQQIHEIYTFILWHYTRGSVYETPFWRTAQAETTVIIEQPNASKELLYGKFEHIIDLVKSLDYIDCRVSDWNIPDINFGQWSANSIKLWYDEYIK